MIGFFIVATLLLLAALALVVYPLLRGQDSGREDRRGDVIGLSRDRLEELKEKRQGGEISEAEYRDRVADLEAQLADDLHSQDSDQDSDQETASSAAPGATRRGGQWLGFAVIAFVPVLAGLLYLTLGTPRALVTDTRTPVSAGSEGQHPTDVESMVAGLAERLDDNPDDEQGWFMLGRSYMQLNRYGEAAEAFARLRELVGDAPNVLINQASAVAMANGGSLAGQPRELIQLALEQQPDHPQALWMAATAAHQAADFDTALAYYRRAEPLLQGELKQQVQARIAELSGEEKSGRTADAAPAGDPATEAAATTSLQVSVDLDPALRERAGDGETVFIFARAVNGPPMPLAVVRKTVADLPVTVTLDETQAMMPQLTLANFDRVLVGARISNSGQPIAQPGDLEGESEPVPTDSPETIAVTIDRVVADQ